jgi:hypothetical protein
VIDLAQFKARVEAARRFEFTVEGGPRLTLQVPSEHELRLYAVKARAGGATDTASLMVEVMRATLLVAVRGWTGVVVDHFLRDGDTEVVEFDRDLVAPLFDAQPDWAEPVITAIQSRIVVRRERTEVAAKN